jgi:hypothetical protein
MSKIVSDKSQVKLKTELHKQEYKLGSFISKIFPEAYSGYPVSGEFYESNNLS